MTSASRIVYGTWIGSKCVTIVLSPLLCGSKCPLLKHSLETSKPPMTVSMLLTLPHPKRPLACDSYSQPTFWPSG